MQHVKMAPSPSHGGLVIRRRVVSHRFLTPHSMFDMFSLRRLLSSLHSRFCAASGPSTISIELIPLTPHLAAMRDEDPQLSYGGPRIEALPWCDDADSIR
jgi:hypothetical protein